jgi:thioredoxin 1
MLYTNLKHIESATEYARIISQSEKLVVICGRMDPMCIPLFRIAEELAVKITQIKFYDMESDNPESYVVHNLPEIFGFKEIPLAIYYKSGQVVKATSGIQSKEQVCQILEQELSSPAAV